MECVFIFIIAIVILVNIISAISGKSGNKEAPPSRRSPDTPKGERPDFGEATGEFRGERGFGPYKEARERMDDVFETLRFPGEEEESIEEEGVEITSKEKEMITEEKPRRRKIPREEQRRKRKSAESRQKWEQEEEAAASPVLFEGNELKKGIIWSEILGPPRSLRPFNYRRR